MKAPHDSRTKRREGTALVMILILSVGTLVLVTTLIGLSQNMAKTERHRRTSKSLQEVVNAGIAMALNEVNRKRLEGNAYTDPTEHGVGAMLFAPGTTTTNQNWQTMGVPIRDANNNIIGRLRADVYKRGDPTGTTPGNVAVGDNTRILRVVVATPGFHVNKLDGIGQLREIAGAEMEIRRGNPPFDRNALSVRGPALSGMPANPGVPASKYPPNPPITTLGGLWGGGNQVSISGLDPAYKVPAINISDTSAYNQFIAGINAFDGSGDNIVGSNADGTATAYQAGTVTNDQAGILNQTTVNEIAAGIDARIAAVLAVPGNQVSATDLDTGSHSLPKGNYFINTTAEIKGTLTGSGTLVLTKGVTVKGKLDWNGDVIIANEQGAGLDVVAGGELRVCDKTLADTSDGTGVLCIQGIGDTTDQLGVHVKGTTNVGDKDAGYPGALTVLGNANTSSTAINIDNGSKLFVYGIMTVMGNALKLVFDTGGHLEVDGSLALITPAGGTGMSIELGNSFEFNLKYSTVAFDSSLNALGQFFDPEGTKLPVSVSAYWETPATKLLEEQNRRCFGVTSDLATFLPIPFSTDFGY